MNRVIKAGRLSVFLTLLITIGQTLYAQVPVAEFTANRTSGCAPLVVTFTDQSTGSPTSWNWAFSNGQLSNVQNPTVTFSLPGTYDVSIVVQNADGTHGITKTAYITVYPSPTANLLANITTGCVPSTIQFTDNSTPNAGTLTSWEWDFGDGTTSTLQNPTHTYNAVGFYTVRLTVTSSTGCVNTRVAPRYIRIVQGVTAQFANTPPVRCTAPFAVNFQNQSSGPGTISYQWDLGNSTTSTAAAPSTTYNTAGTYNVKLVARSQFGCADSITKPITITEYTTAMNAPDTVCLNSTVDFQNASSPAPMSSTWRFGNGVISPRINDTTSYHTPANYQVMLINRYATCIDSVPKTVTVLPRPVVDFTADNLIGCQAPFTVNFQDISPDAVAWQWNFGDGNTSTAQNPQYTYQDTGRFDVTLTITTSKGCQNTITKTGYIQIIKPQVRIINLPSGGCAPVNFTPVATVNSIDGVAGYVWDWGDGSPTSTAPNPGAHLYNTPGLYIITLRVTTNGGCTETVTGDVRVGTQPVVDFNMSSSDTCSSSIVNFTGLNPTNNVDTWLWDFGDGSTSTQRDPTHGFTDTGMITVTLVGVYNRCASAPVVKTIHIKPPVAEFAFSVAACIDKRRVLFDDLSQTDPNYGPVSYLWEFGDPANSTSTFPGDTVFTYPTIGDFNVRLTVTNGSCSQTFASQVRLVGDVADFTISKSNLCRNEQFTATATGSVPANISRYEWSINGGPFIIGGSSLTYGFPANGVYDIALRITDINGCQDTQAFNDTLRVGGPTANFTTTNPGGCSNTLITFDDLSIPAGGITNWTWNFDDGTGNQTLTAPFTHNFADTGTYTIRLTVSDAAGCTSTYTLPDSLIITRPQVGFTSNFNTICPNVPLQFTDTSRGRSLSWLWDLGDGNISTQQNPLHNYAGNDSDYVVKLVITDQSGCRDSVTKQILVRSPKAAFTVTDTSTICPPIATNFTFQGRDYASYYWDFGDGTGPSNHNQPDPTWFYNAFGSYTATLTLVGYGGCTADTSVVINVYNPNASTIITYSPIRACNELTVNFNVTTPPSTAFTFYFGDGGLDDSQSPSFSHFYSRPNYYNPYLILRDSQNCQVTITGSPRIEVIGAIPLFGKDKKQFCDSGIVTFQNYTLAPNDPVVSRRWDFGDGNTSTDVNPVHFYRQPGTYIITQSVTTTQGCSNEVSDTVRVYGTPFTRINGDSIVCINELLPLQGELIRPDTSITWNWNLGNGSSSTDATPAVTYGAAGHYTISLITSNLLNCRDTTYKAVYVPNDPVITVETEPVIVVGTGIDMPVTYSDSIATYVWTPSNRLSCTDCPIPFANPQFTTTYKVSVEDVYGCKSSRDITVTVICNQENYFIPNTFSPNGDGMNDIFAPRGKSIHRINSMKIFNRWGELVWEKRNFMANDRTTSGGWDGTFKGKPAQQDVYVYIIELVCDNAQIIPYKGNVALVR